MSYSGNLRQILFAFILSNFFFGSSCTKSVDTNKDNLVSYADTARLKTHIANLVQFKRDYMSPASLDSSAEYIKNEFLKISPNVEDQPFIALGAVVYRNIICSLGPANAERIIIGAHYDVCGEQAGADDNASGVAGMLELARLLKKDSLKYRIDFVAYSLEEPPFFGTGFMGSFVHAKSLYDKKVQVKGMICLEMIGYFSDETNSQKYPLGFLKWFYGSKGNFITVVQKFNNGKFGRQVENILKQEHSLPTKFFKGPKSIPGIDFSDHRNYWHYGYSAVMITNTAFYRNKNYHTPGDLPETLDYKRMGLVVDELYNLVKKIN